MSRQELIQSWIVNNPELVYDPASGLIFCTKCETHVTATHKSSVDRHIKSALHQGRRQQRSQEEFYLDFVEFLILCNIPWSVVSKLAFIKFFDKYLCGSCCCICPKKVVPSESILRKKYCDIVFNKKLKSVYDAIRDNKIWVSVDETTDFKGRFVVNLLVMPLIKNLPTKPYLIACGVLEKVNGATMSEFVTNSLRNMWGDFFEEKVNDVLMLCTDSVAYMLRAGRLLKTDFPNMIHVTCLAHALNRVAEQVRSQYANVDILIANVKKVFLKAPNRVKILKEMYPDLPLPPQPVITRWGTWLQAVSYYSIHFENISNVLNRLDSSEALSIAHAKNVMRNEHILSEIHFIHDNFSIIENALTKLQKNNLTLSKTLEILDNVRCALNWSSNEIVQDKLENVLQRNPDYDVIRTTCENIVKGIETDHESFYKFAPLTSVDVERSFSTYKWILNVQRNRLKEENIEKLMVIYFNSHNNPGEGFNAPESEIDSENVDPSENIELL